MPDFVIFSICSETHHPGPDIHSGKTGHDLPVLEAARLDPEVFAAFTGPDGGLTSICNLGDKFTASVMQVPNTQYPLDILDIRKKTF